MAKKYTIERTDPTHGRIAELNIEGKRISSRIWLGILSR